MQESILTENVISLHDGCKLVPSSRSGKKLNIATMWRWINDGVLALDGSRVKLQAIRLGGRWLTSHEAIERFSAALTGDTGNAPAPIRTPAARSRAAEVARKKLEAIGI